MRRAPRNLLPSGVDGASSAVGQSSLPGGVDAVWRVPRRDSLPKG